MIGGGLGGWEQGEWTDDTQMAICIAEEAPTGHLDPTVVAEHVLDRYRSGPADVGIQTRAVPGQIESRRSLGQLRHRERPKAGTRPARSSARSPVRLVKGLHNMRGDAALRSDRVTVLLCPGADGGEIPTDRSAGGCGRFGGSASRG
jgi:ADP-ribosylglycohydrolase